MTRLLVGAGGWAYFEVQGLDRLKAYSSAFDFVEVNSTYYEFPDLRTVSAWRSRVPQRFEFSVRCNKGIVNALRSAKGTAISSIMSRMEQICRILRANILTLLIPEASGLDETQLVPGLEEAISTFHAGNTKIAIEFRGKAQKKVFRVMKENDAIHSVDISKERPAYESTTLYSRLFGKGHDNVYQFDDEELKEIAGKASAPKFQRSILAFHGVRMYGDAARLKAFLHTERFPQVTGQTGLESLGEVLREDATFPATKSKLVAEQGWKLFDVKPDKRVRAHVFLSKLPEGTYHSPNEVTTLLQHQSLLEAQPSRTTRATTQHSS